VFPRVYSCACFVEVIAPCLPGSPCLALSPRSEFWVLPSNFFGVFGAFLLFLLLDRFLLCLQRKVLLFSDVAASVHGTVVPG